MRSDQGSRAVSELTSRKQEMFNPEKPKHAKQSRHQGRSQDKLGGQIKVFSEASVDS